MVADYSGRVAAVRTVTGSTETVLVELDNGVQFEISVDVAAKHQLRIGVELSEEMGQRIECDEVIAKAVKDAARHMRMRPRTAKEVESYLKRRGYARAVIDEVMVICVARGYVDDERYAELFVHDRLRNHPCGRKLLRIELLRRGIRADVVEQTLSNHDLNEREVAAELVQRKISKMLSAPTVADARKLANFLMRRGFSSQVVMDLLRELNDAFEC